MGDNEVDARQQNVGRDNMEGSGEWPSPSESEPRGPAPGVAESGDGWEKGSQFKDTAFKDAVEADPVLGGSGSVGEPDVSDAASD